ncbi:hypothetical protein LSTR_LSTR004982 [Laodelphax striatellus]|uniref:Uncharacterized protein n=1 Tax=Laodelphax striatellus TaxID=195883 RepID=A0A482XN33_LAOST|nr:hypothetical protein LSTR_LSTR004982 [Laodelphax striatellus]
MEGCLRSGVEAGLGSELRIELWSYRIWARKEECSCALIRPPATSPAKNIRLLSHYFIQSFFLRPSATAAADASLSADLLCSESFGSGASLRQYRCATLVPRQTLTTVILPSPPGHPEDAILAGVPPPSTRCHRRLMPTTRLSKETCCTHLHF